MPKTAALLDRTVHLTERIDQLSVKRQEIIRPILEHPREYVLLSVRALAKRLRTDPATIIRIVHGVGFENYKQFQRHVHELSLAYATSLYTMQQSEGSGATHNPVRDSVYRDLKNLQGLKNALDPARLTALAKKFYAARRIVLLGGDLAAVLAEYLGYQLNLLGLPISVATSSGAATHTVHCTGQRHADRSGRIPAFADHGNRPRTSRGAEAGFALVQRLRMIGFCRKQDV